MYVVIEQEKEEDRWIGDVYGPYEYHKAIDVALSINAEQNFFYATVHEVKCKD